MYILNTKARKNTSTTEIYIVYKVLVTDLQNYQEIHSKLY